MATGYPFWQDSIGERGARTQCEAAGDEATAGRLITKLGGTRRLWLTAGGPAQSSADAADGQYPEGKMPDMLREPTVTK